MTDPWRTVKIRQSTKDKIDTMANELDATIVDTVDAMTEAMWEDIQPALEVSDIGEGLEIEQSPAEAEVEAENEPATFEL